MEGVRARPWPGGKSHSNEIGSIWKVCFSATQMHIYWPHLIMDHLSEAVRAWEGGRQQSHMKGDRDYISHFGTAVSNHQNCLHLKVRSAFVAYCQLLSAPFCFDRNWDYTVLSNAILPEAPLHKLFSYAVRCMLVRSAEQLLSACLHMLMHGYKNPDTVVNAQYVQSKAKLSETALNYITFNQWTVEARQRSKSHIQSQYVYSVEVCH